MVGFSSNAKVDFQSNFFFKYQNYPYFLNKYIFKTQLSIIKSNHILILTTSTLFLIAKYKI